MATWNWNVLTGSTNTPGAIARWLNKSTLTSGIGGDADLILSEATSWIFTRLRHWQMLTSPQQDTTSVGVGSDLIPVPTDMLEPDMIWIAGIAGGQFYQQELKQKEPNDIYRFWCFDGNGNRVLQTPVMYSFNQTYIQFDSPCDLAYPFFITYYQRPVDLSALKPTNFLTQNYQRLLRVTTMMLGAEWAKESNQGQYDRTYWEQQAEDELQNVQAQSDRARRAQVQGPRFEGGGYGALNAGYSPGGYYS
jgi:hypothetical protein